MSDASEEKHDVLGAEFLRSIIESLPLMVFVKDAAELRFELCNRAGEELLGRRREELIGRNDHDLFPKDQADFFTAKDLEALASAGPIEVTEEPISTPRGVRWLRTMKMAIRDEAGVARHLLGISEDIAAKRELAEALSRTEGKLRHAQRMDEMGKLASGIAHDFNNTLTVILTYADLAMESLHGSDPVRDHVLEITKAATRAADLTRQLLAFTRSQAATPRVVDVNELIGEMERMLRRVLEESIELTTALAPMLWKVSADSTALEQVLMNLVANARHAMPRGGKVILETSNVEIDEAIALAHPGMRPGSYVALVVSDTGVGMDRETMARVFEPFFTTKAPGEGTGLGLWNVYGVVRQLGGTVWAYSELGVGTTFKVYLPRAVRSSADATLPEPAPTRNKRGSETILVVDDEEPLVRAVTSMLRRNGYVVLGARSPAEALLVSEQHAGSIDLLLTDVMMPLLDGQQLAERLRGARPKMKVAFMSGYTLRTLERYVQLAPRAAWIEKPFSTATLLETVRDVLRAEAPAAPSSPK